MSERCRVVISGRTLDGAPLSSLKAEVGRVFRLGDKQLDRMLSGKPQVVSRSTTAEAAEQLLARLRALGLEARAEPLAENRGEVPAEPRSAGGSPAPAAGEELFALAGAPAGAYAAGGGSGGEGGAVEEVSCPKCGESQPKRTLCRACGLDMPRYRAIREAEEREQRAARAAELEARRANGGRGARTHDSGRSALLSLSFAGRFGRLDYLAGSVLSTVLWFAFVWLAVVTGKSAFAGLGLLLSSIYALRCIALRLHDTGRTGWLALVVIVPLIGALMALALLFIGGEEDENEYGPALSEAGGARALLALAACAVISVVGYRSMTGSPEQMLRFVDAMSFGQGPSALADDAGEGFYPGEAVRYAPNNRIDIYVVGGCSDCAAMLAWLDMNGLYATVYRVDRDRQAAERLNSIIGGSGRVQLPVLEVNGKVLSPNPEIDEVHDRLRVESE